MVNDPAMDRYPYLDFLDGAQKQAVRELEIPDTYQVFDTVPNQQEYEVYEQIKTYAVYVGGQLLQPSSVGEMEGWNNHLYDQARLGTAPPTGSGAVPGTIGTESPNWTQAPPQVYPAYTGWENAPKPINTPWGNFQNAFQPQRYYWRFPGTIGIVPAPASNAPNPQAKVAIYGVCEPPTITVATQVMLVPESFKMYMCWYVVWLIRTSESSPSQAELGLVQIAQTAMLAEAASLRLKNRSAKGKQRRGFNTQPSRSRNSMFHVRRNGSGSGWW